MEKRLGEKTNATNLGRRRFMAQAGSAVGLLAASGGSALAQTPQIRWGSANLGSSGYVILEAMSHISNKYTESKNSVFATTGTLENFSLMGADELEFSHTTSFDWMVATRGDKPFAAPVRANQMFAYVQWLVPPLVNAKSDIMTVADLAGRSYSASKPAGGSTQLSRILFQEAGILDDIKWVYGSFSDVYDSFSVGNIDCVYGVFTNGTPLGLISQLELTMELRALEYPQAVLDAAMKANPGIQVGQLTPDDWPTLDRPIRTPAMTGILGADDRVSAEIGYDITKAVLENAEELKQYGLPLAGVNSEDAVRNLLPAYPVNAGAAQYFKELGIWREELTIAAS